MRNRLSLLTAALIGFGAGSAVAQDMPSSDQAPITVEGRRNRDENIRALVNSLPPAPVNGHVRRFEQAICPRVAGLPAAQRDAVIRRMRAIGGAAGVAIGSGNCRPNVLVLVTSDRRRLIEQLDLAFPNLFGGLSNREMTRLAASSEPAALWYLTTLVDADGRERGSGARGDPAEAEDPHRPVKEVFQRTTQPQSRIADLAHPDFYTTILVIEARALAGLSTTQLADYAAVRTLTGADPSRLGDAHVSTILNVLDAPMGSEIPVTLTNWDLAFLRSLYASDASRYAPGQRREIRAAMSRQLAPTAERAQPD